MHYHLDRLEFEDDAHPDRMSMSMCMTKLFSEKLNYPGCLSLVLLLVEVVVQEFEFLVLVVVLVKVSSSTSSWAFIIINSPGCLEGSWSTLPYPALPFVNKYCYWYCYWY